MQRPIVYSLEQIRAFDTLWGWRDTLYGIAGINRTLLGNAISGVINGFEASPTATLSLAINMAEGWISQKAAVDSTIYGALGADTTTVMQQGYLAASSQTFTTANLAGGQSQWVLLQAQFLQSDQIRVGDPNAGILPYINTANPNVPFQGPGNSGVSQSTERLGTVQFQQKYGTPATTGSELAPLPDSGWLPYLLVHLDFGQTTISGPQILLAGPTPLGSSQSSYPNAPYFPGVIGQIPGSSGGSHHGGIAGQASKINMTAGAEITGIPPLGNLPATNSVANPVAGVVIVPSELAVIQAVNADPNGQIQGMVNDLAYNVITKVLFVCTTSGSTSTAVWTGIGSGGVSSYQNANFNATGGNFQYLSDTSGGALVATLQLASTFGGTGVTFLNIGTNNLTITPQSSEKINGLPVGTSIVVLPGNSISLSSRSGTGFYTYSSPTQYAPVAKAGSFTANAPDGTLYTNTLTANAVVTLPASNGGGGTQAFCMDPSSGSFGQTFLTTGSDTIVNGGTINGPGTTNQLTMPTWRAGTMVLVKVPGGYRTI